MFDRVKTFVEGVIRKMFPAKNIKESLRVETCLTEEMTTRIELWGMMYEGKAPWCKKSVRSLKKEQGICREFANVVLNEMESKVSIDALDKIYQTSIRELNENLQSGLALGSFVIKPLGGNKVEYITADKFIPLEYDSRGRMVDVLFVQVKKIEKNEIYHRFERHSFADGRLEISNRAFVSENEESVGREIPLAAVEEWAKLPEQIAYDGLNGPDFGYYRNPIKNAIDGSHAGISIFESAVDLIQDADEQYAGLKWEFKSGERAVHVDPTALQPKVNVVNGKKYMVNPELDERLFVCVDLADGEAKDLYREWSPEFRDANIISGLNNIFRQIEFNVSLSYGDISDVSEVEKTATETRVAKKRKYNMVTAIQENLKECLEDLVYALAFYNAMTKSGYEFICAFKDSILVDEETERENDRKDVAAGFMQPWEYRMKWYQEDAETAKQMVLEPDGVME